MRILQINKFFYEKGGTERYFFSLSRGLETRGHTVSHFAMRHPDNVASPYAEFFVSEREYTGRGGRLDDIPAGFSFIRSAEAAKRLARLIDVVGPEIAHLHNIYHQITPSIIPVLGRAGIPVVMTLHDHKLVCPNYSLFDGRGYCYRCRGGRFFRATLTRCNERSFRRSLLLSIEAYWQKLTRVYDGVRFFLAPSRYLREVFLAEGFSPERVVYLPPFVDERPGAGTGVEGGGLDGLPQKYVLYFGRLSLEKGLFTLLDAIARLQGVSLVVCGDGSLRSALEERATARANGRVQFTGYLEKPTLDGVIRGSAAVVLPSESPENAPYTVLEAMGHGVPVVVSDVGGLPELARTGGGVVFAAKDAAGLAEKIDGLWQDENLAAEIGRRGKRAVAGDFAEKRHLDDLESVYQKALGST